MLVLSRQRDESIIIGDNIQVTVVDIRGDKVRLGFDAPKELPVHRKEVYDTIRRERNVDVLIAGPSLPPDAFVFFKDGNRWAAVRPNFINLIESPAGFGDDWATASVELAKCEKLDKR